MIPDNRFSSETYKGQLLNPWSRDRKRSYHWGPREVQDPSAGLLVKVWTLQANGPAAILSAAGSPTRTLFTRSVDLEVVTLAFDQNGRPCVCFEEAGGSAYLFWFDPTVNAEVFFEIPDGATSPRVTLDDARAFNVGNSDVILAYVRAGFVRYRIQRERFETERTPLFSGSPAPASALRHVSMNSNLRLEFLTDGAGAEPWTLADIVEDLTLRSGVPPQSVDVRELFDTYVEGFKVDTDDGINKRIDALREMFFFDKSEHDRKIFFPRRGREVAARIPYIDLVADDPSALKETRIQELDLPKAITVNHLDPAGEFAANKQTARRKSNLIKATKERTVESEVVLTADQAMTAATVKLKIEWHEQQTYKFATWIKYANVVPTDTVEVQDKKGHWHRIRVTERNDDHPLIMFEGVADAGQAVYNTLGVGHSLPPPVSTTPGIIGETHLEILNIPTLRDQDDELGVYIAVAGETSAWYGAQILVSTDEGANFYEAMQIETPATLGEILTELRSETSAEYPADQSFEVLTNFPLESVTYANLLNNVNRCVVGDELLQFQIATPLGMEGGKYRYRCSGLVRGRYATPVEDWPAGTRFVLLDSSIAFLQAQQWMLGQEIQIKPVSLGQTEDETVATAYDFDEGVSQREFPVHSVKASRDGSDNVTISFIGRGRLGIETAPRNGKYFTGYRVKFSNGHTIDTTAMRATYSAAPAGVTVQVCALNSVTGEGPYSTPVAT